tara:strand:- start:305 stop:529 length:225 start_codon:yes stop_codon:yes gene_type:complete
MSKKQTLKFTIKQDGSISEEVIGAVGKECLNITEEIDIKLGTLDTKTFKPEYYQESLLTQEEQLPEFTHDSECA